MNSTVSFSILRLSRWMNIHRVPLRYYCSALKPQTEVAINCLDVMKGNEAYLRALVNQTDTSKINQSINTVSVSDIVDDAYKGEFSLPKFVKLLKFIKQQSVVTDNSFDIGTNLKFLQLCAMFEANCHNCSPFLLTSALKSLLTLNTGQQSSTIEAICTTIIQKIDKFDGTDMVDCLMVLHLMDDLTDTQRNIVDIMLNAIPQKIHDFSLGSSVFKLIRIHVRFGRKTTRKLDFKLAELVKDFTPHYLYKLLCLLSEKQSRNKTLLNAISSSMQNCESKPNLKQTVDILYALNSLNFQDSSLLLYLTDDKTSEISAVEQPPLISSLLTVCGYLRWHHKGIIEACGKWVVDNIDKCSSREFVSYVLTAATLNYTFSDVIIQHLLPHLKEEKIAPSIVWLDVVWSLAILGCVDKEMLLGVLKKDFYEPLLDGDDFRVTSNKLKLMNLKSVLKNKYPEHVFSCDLFLDSVEMQKSFEVENSKKSVISALSNFILPGKYMYTNQYTDMGISIDAEFIMDDKGKPLPLSDYGSAIKSRALVKQLPPGARRVAVLVLTHKNFTLNEPHVTGIISLTTELLKSQGYVVVQIPYSEFSANLTTVKKVHYMQKKIMSTMQT